MRPMRPLESIGKAAAMQAQRRPFRLDRARRAFADGAPAVYANMTLTEITSSGLVRITWDHFARAARGEDAAPETVAPSLEAAADLIDAYWDANVRADWAAYEERWAWLTTSQAAEALGVSVATFRRLAKAHGIAHGDEDLLPRGRPGGVVYMWRPADVEALRSHIRR